MTMLSTLRSRCQANFEAFGVALLSIALTVCSLGPTMAATSIVGQKIESPPTTQLDDFGYSVAISGSTALVGAPRDDSAAQDGGIVHIFQADASGTWQPAGLLSNAYTLAFDRFGEDIAIDGDVAVVGAPGDLSQPYEIGKARIFLRDEQGDWNAGLFIQPSGLTQFGAFGQAVAVEGETVVISAPRQQVAGQAVAGAAYVFEKSGVDFGQNPTAMLTSDVPTHSELFGRSVAVLDGQILIGSRTGLNVFERVNDAWELAQQVSPSGQTDLTWFGDNMAANGNLVVMGDALDNTFGSEAGAVYVFQRDAGGSWSQSAKLFAGDPGPSGFGYSVAVWGDSILVGAYADDEAELNAGAAYLFGPDGLGGWTQTVKYVADDAQDYANLGRDVALWGSRALVAGARPTDPSRSNTGAVYAFPIPEPSSLALLLVGLLARAFWAIRGGGQRRSG